MTSTAVIIAQIKQFGDHLVVVNAVSLRGEIIDRGTISMKMK
jgi:hypothetical protein